LRHSVVWRDGSNWTFKYRRWLVGVRLDDRALAATFAHYSKSAPKQSFDAPKDEQPRPEYTRT
jgi:hypothetical protein